MTEEHEKWIESVDNALMDLRTINRDLGIENDSLRADNARLEAENAKMREALESINGIAEEKLGEWLGVEPPHIPSNLMPYYEIGVIFDTTLSQSTDESEPTDD